MKDKDIARHTLQHIWVAYVKKVLAEDDKAWSARKLSHNRFPFYIYTFNKDGKRIEIMNYTLFREILEKYLLLGRTAVIKGFSFNIPHCGYIAGKRIARDFRSKKKRIDWARTSKGGYTIDENGKRKYNKIFYQVSDEYLRIGWFKPITTGIESYVFDPCHSRDKDLSDGKILGFAEEFSDANNKDPYLKYVYIYCPIKDYVQVPKPEPQCNLSTSQ